MPEIKITQWSCSQEKTKKSLRLRIITQKNLVIKLWFGSRFHVPIAFLVFLGLSIFRMYVGKIN